MIEILVMKELKSFQGSRIYGQLLHHSNMNMNLWILWEVKRLKCNFDFMRKIERKYNTEYLNPLSVNPKKWSNTLKQIVG